MSTSPTSAIGGMGPLLLSLLMGDQFRTQVETAVFQRWSAVPLVPARLLAIDALWALRGL